MFALGVGLYFLPRLRGCPAPSARAVRTAALLLGGGLALRALSQPAVAASEPGSLRAIAGGALMLSGLLELGGVGLAVGALIRAERRGPPIASRTGLVAVVPFALTFFASLMVALTINVVVLVTDAQSTGLGARFGRLDDCSPRTGRDARADLGGRLGSHLPLFLRLRVPSQRELHAVFAVYLTGLLLRLTSALDLPPELQPLPPLGSVILGLAVVGVVVIVDVPFRRSLRTRAGQAWPSVPEYRASEWLIVPGYTWLGAAGLLMVLEGLAWWGLAPRPPLDAERHALGAGLVTLLILGMAIRMVPGFAGSEALLGPPGLGHRLARQRCGVPAGPAPVRPVLPRDDGPARPVRPARPCRHLLSGLEPLGDAPRAPRRPAGKSSVPLAGP